MKATRFLEGQLTMSKPPEHEPLSKTWHGSVTYFHKGSDWKSGSTLLYPAGFAQGHTVRFLTAISLYFVLIVFTGFQIQASAKFGREI